MTIQNIKERRGNNISVNNSRTRAKKEKVQEEYTGAKRNVNKSVREDTRNYIETPATKAEEAAHQNRMKNLSTLHLQQIQRQLQANCQSSAVHH
ncbi:hypothetical protein DPMN_121198 [Dreissena polymorpha]|uniref:Uncharacterized protein n=1 Tax=Dreissena polymorpha TaxID=45954 RepID=A0A9D4GMB9_DREPO|nr:hypothetical protein DPMN_121198 [Dreissena polymorpha]